MKKINIIQTRKIWLTISGSLVGLSLLALILWGFKFGIDFTGGSLLEVKFNQERPVIKEVEKVLGDLSLGSLTVQPVDERGLLLRFQDTSEEKHQAILNALNNLARKPAEGSETKATSTVQSGQPVKIESEGGQGITAEISTSEDEKPAVIEELRYDSVGPSIGKELQRKSIYAIFFVLVAIILYIAWSFRQVSKPVSSWKYGLAAIIALFHDVLITMGVFAVLGEFFGVEVNTSFIAAILTVLGYSVNDTIVVFDRIRENLPRSSEDFEGTINTSINQTLARSINTSFTVILTLIAIVLFGGESIRSFALALSIGVFVGTYSSIFIASPLVVIWERRKMKNN